MKQPPFVPPPGALSDGREQGAPRRGDAVEAWLKRKRDEWHESNAQVWEALDELLDDYRLHADCGVHLRNEVPTGEGWDY